MKNKLLVIVPIVIILMILSFIIIFKNQDPLEYTILDSSFSTDDYTERGYYLEDSDDGKIILTIAMGKKPTSGYSISVEKTNVNDYNVEVYVQVEYPSADFPVSMVLTYPIVQIEFSGSPKSIIVQNTDGEEFSRVYID